MGASFSQILTEIRILWIQAAIYRLAKKYAKKKEKKYYDETNN